MADPKDLSAQVATLSKTDRDVFFNSLANVITADELNEMAKSIQLPKPPVPDEMLRLAYKEYGDQIRHFSTVRSGLTTFLLTVALAAFSAYFNVSQRHFFLIVAGFIFATAAFLACMSFSYRTEQAVIRYKKIWKYFTQDAVKDSVNAINDKTTWTEVWMRMVRDPMNWLLVFGLTAILLTFYNRDHLDPVLWFLRLK